MNSTSYGPVSSIQYTSDFGRTTSHGWRHLPKSKSHGLLWYCDCEQDLDRHLPILWSCPSPLAEPTCFTSRLFPTTRNGCEHRMFEAWKVACIQHHLDWLLCSCTAKLQRTSADILVTTVKAALLSLSCLPDLTGTTRARWQRHSLHLSTQYKQDWNEFVLAAQ